MSPMQFFRKYSRSLVLVIMALLLVVFLLEPVLMNPSSATEAGRTMGQAFGQPITLNDLQRAGNDFEIVLEIEPSLVPPLSDRDESGRSLSALLLQREAAHLGLHISGTQVRQMMQNSQIPPHVIDTIAARRRRSVEGVYEAIGRVLAIRQVAFLQLEAGTVASLPELEHEYRQRMQQAVIRLSVIEGRAFLPNIDPPNDAELAAFFEQTRDRAFDPDEVEVKFGYRLDDRVEIEFLTVNPARLAGTTISAREARQYYDKNKATYAASLPPDPVTSRPAAPPEYEALPAEIQRRVRENARQEKIVFDARRTMEAIRDAARSPWEAMDIGADGFRLPPPEDRLPSFEELQQRFSRDGIPVEFGRVDLTEIIALNLQPSGIGRASTRVGRRDVALAELVRRTKGLGTPPPPETRDESGLGWLNIGEPGPLLAEHVPDPKNPRERRPHQAYVFRVVKVVPAGPPDSLDMVREKVITDWRLRKAHEIAGEHAARLAERAREVGLDAAVAEAEELRAILATGETAGPATQPAVSSIPPELHVRFVERLGPFTPDGNFTRSTTWGANFGDASELPKRVFELADAPESQPTGRRVALVPSADDVRWLVAEVVEVKPLYEGEFAQRLPMLINLGRQTEQRDLQTLWFNSEQIRARAGFRVRD